MNISKLPALKQFKNTPIRLLSRLVKKSKIEAETENLENSEDLNPWQRYENHVGESIASFNDRQEAMAHAIGGNYISFGIVMRNLLQAEGLEKNHSLVDIGCGSGRLAFGLKRYLTGRLVGLDVVPSLIEHARKIVGRPDWKFLTSNGLEIAEPDESIDFVTAFSVFTHLRHEQTYKYLFEAKRVLRPGGKIIFSFLQFPIPCHWDVFEANLKDIQSMTHLNQFMSIDAVEVWAKRLGLDLVSFADGDKPHISIDEIVTLDDGRIFEKKACLGQSICVLKKPLK